MKRSIDCDLNPNNLAKKQILNNSIELNAPTTIISFGHQSGLTNAPLHTYQFILNDNNQTIHSKNTNKNENNSNNNQSTPATNSNQADNINNQTTSLIDNQSAPFTNTQTNLNQNNKLPLPELFVFDTTLFQGESTTSVSDGMFFF